MVHAGNRKYTALEKQLIRNISSKRLKPKAKWFKGNSLAMITALKQILQSSSIQFQFLKLHDHRKIYARLHYERIITVVESRWWGTI